MTEMLAMAKRHGTDKAGHRYDIAYTFLMADRRQEPLRILEIGVKKGASLRLWENYFPRAEVFGIDIDPTCKKYKTARTNVYVGRQADTIFLDKFIESSGGKFDLIVDDGAHMPDYQVASLHYLWPHLNVSGFYAVEDTHAHEAKPKKYGLGKSKLPALCDLVLGRAKNMLLTCVIDGNDPGMFIFNGMCIFYKYAHQNTVRLEIT